MYAGYAPVDYGSDDFNQAFVPTIRMAADVSGAECIYPAPPMDEYGGTIAFGKPSSNDFEGSFNCGKFRFDVAACSVFDVDCTARLIRVFSIPNGRFVSYQLWDECRGIFVISNGDISVEAESWKFAEYAVGNRGLFGQMSTKCLTLSETQ